MDGGNNEPRPTLPCPFCLNGRLYAAQDMLENGMSGPFSINCVCGARGPTHDSLAEAVKLWDTRTVRQRKRA
jgi:hypothetical protein